MFNITDDFNVYVYLKFHFILLNQKEFVSILHVYFLSWKFPQLNLTSPLMIKPTNQNKRLEISVLFVSIEVEPVKDVTEQCSSGSKQNQKRHNNEM